MLSRGQKDYLKKGHTKTGNRQLRFRLKAAARQGLEDITLTASGLESGDHAEVFTLEAIEPLFKALADYANHRPEDGGNAVVRNVRLFRLLYGVSNRCLTGARALLKPDFEKMLWLGGGGLSMQELDMLKIAWSSVLTDSDMKKET